jgi:hypothetical protein
MLDQTIVKGASDQHTMVEPFPNAGTATHEVKLRAAE